MVSRACSPAVLRPPSFFTAAHDDRVKQRVGAQRGAARSLKIGAAGRFSRIGDQDDHAPPARRVAAKRLRAQIHRVI